MYCFSGRTRQSTSVLPVSRTPLQVGDGDNHDLGWSKPVDDLVGKPGHHGAAGLAVGRNRGADVRVVGNSRERRADRVEELTAQPRAPGLRTSEPPRQT